MQPPTSPNTVLVILTFAALYWFPIRRWMNHWGATPSDLARVMAGDSLVPDHTYSGTTAVTVNARPEHIWPWLVQIGYQRGGLTATTGSIASSAISIVRAPRAFSPRFSTSRLVTTFPSDAAQLAGGGPRAQSRARLGYAEHGPP